MSWLFIGSYVRLAPAVDQGHNEPGDCGLRMDEGLSELQAVEDDCLTGGENK